MVKKERIERSKWMKGKRTQYSKGKRKLFVLKTIRVKWK